MRFVNAWAGATEMKYGTASWDHKFKDTHLTIRQEKGELVVEEFNVYKDDSGRSNYTEVYKFKKLWALEHWSRWALDCICGLGY